jgi:hypothetical protein
MVETGTRKELEKVKEREIKGTAQTDIVERVVAETVEALGDEMIGAPIKVVVPFKFKGKQYSFTIRPMDTEQQTNFAINYPDASDPDSLSPERMKEIIEAQKKELLANITAHPYSGPLSLQHLNKIRPNLFKELIEVLTGDEEEDFTEK